MRRTATAFKALGLTTAILLTLSAYRMRAETTDTADAGPRRVAPVAVQSTTAPTLRLASKQTPLLIETVEGLAGASAIEVVLESGTAVLELATPPSEVDIVSWNRDPAQAFGATVRSRSDLGVGEYTGELTVRACAQAPCSGAALASLTIPYTLRVRPAPPAAQVPGEWETFQGNAAHTGYVPVQAEPAKWRVKWSWQRPTTGKILGPATENGRVYISEAVYHSTGYVRGFDEETGAVSWELSFPNVPALNPPAVKDGRLYVATTGHEQTFLFALDSSNGDSIWRAPFEAQWPSVLAPTIANGIAYTNGGYYRGGTYAFGDAGDRLWAQFHGDDDMTTPAVDATHAYFYDGANLRAYDARTGSLVTTIADPYVPQSAYSYKAAPVIMSPGNVLAYSGGSDYSSLRLLVSYSVTGQKALWRTARPYLTHPAVGNGYIYAASTNPVTFDAIDQTTGKVAWSWTPPPGDTGFLADGNVLLTENMVFVSTDRAVYGIDLRTRKPIWSYPRPGTLAMSPKGTLYVIESGDYYSAGRLTAIGR